MSLLAVAATLAVLGQPQQISHVPGIILAGGPTELNAGEVAAAGDVNRDGFGDVLVYSLNAVGTISGLVRLYSGFDGALLHTFSDLDNHPDGVHMAGVGDVDGDGYADVLIGSGEANVATLYSGRDFSVLHTFVGDLPGDGFGGAVAAAGDVNADGRPDLVIGTTGQFMAGEVGYARVFSGADGSELFTFQEESEFDSFGSAVGSAGDVNGDGHADVAVGAYNDGHDVLNPGFPPFVPPFWTEDAAGTVTVYSGADGSMLWSVHGDVEWDQFGWSVAPAGDVDGDGHDDVLAGTRSTDNPPSVGYARVLSGVDGTTLKTLGGPLLQAMFVTVSGPGDLDGDGVPDLLVGNLVELDSP